MHVMRVLDVAVAPSIGMYTGQCGSQAVLDRLNAQWADAAGVMFSSGTGFSEHYNAFTQKIREMDKIAHEAISTAMIAACNPNKIMPLTCMDDLIVVPAAMHIPLLTSPKLRELYDSGQIYGWGVKYTELPQDDVVGRLIENGTIHLNAFDPTKKDGKAESPDCLTYQWQSFDPDYGVEELNDIQTSRGFIDSFLEEQLGKEGSRIDPTDLTGTIGSLK